MYRKIYDYCEAVIHLESSHTRVPQQTNEDKETITIIQRWKTVLFSLKVWVQYVLYSEVWLVIQLYLLIRSGIASSPSSLIFSFPYVVLKNGVGWA